MAKSTNNNKSSSKLDSIVTPIKAAVKSTYSATKKSCAVPSCDCLKAEIGQKAKEIWEKKGRPNGKDMENWVEAENIIKKKYGIK
jgi:hypothetical protein